jgi:hypothetical protein
MKCVTTVGIFLLLPFLLRILLTNSNVTRRQFALITSLLLAIANFLLVIMFVEEDTFTIGALMCIVSEDVRHN